jgi:hypothetical protein
MSTYEPQYGTGYTSDRELRIDRRIELSWASIWGGTVLGWGALIFLSLIGALIGFATIDPWSSNPGSNVGVGSYVWGALELIVCAVLGGFLVARMAGSRRRRDAALHAGIGWALSMLAGALLAMSIASTATRAAAEKTPRTSAAARGDRGLTQRERARMDRTAEVGTATTAVGAGTAFLALAGALLGSMMGAAAASGRRLGEALHLHGRGGQPGLTTDAADRVRDEDRPTILPPTH